MSEPTFESILADKNTESGKTNDLAAFEAPNIKLVVFTLGTQSFALPGAQIREILADPPVYFVPGAPPALEGVISVRGVIESVLRLQVLLQLPLPVPDSASRARRVLLARGEQVRSGLRVDEVRDVLDLPMSALRAVPDTLPAHLRPFVRHLAHIDARAVSLLDLDTLFGAYREHAG
jgi:purine-binding chemotaxis protein CheW